MPKILLGSLGMKQHFDGYPICQPTDKSRDEGNNKNQEFITLFLI
ncbi:MAG: hypothetical protein R2796_06225 [Chitinophagaceae bacterium]